MSPGRLVPIREKSKCTADKQLSLHMHCCTKAPTWSKLFGVTAGFCMPFSALRIVCCVDLAGLKDQLLNFRVYDKCPFPGPALDCGLMRCALQSRSPQSPLEHIPSLPIQPQLPRPDNTKSMNWDLEQKSQFIFNTQLWSG